MPMIPEAGTVDDLRSILLHLKTAFLPGSTAMLCSFKVKEKQESLKNSTLASTKANHFSNLWIKVWKRKDLVLKLGHGQIALSRVYIFLTACHNWWCSLVLISWSFILMRNLLENCNCFKPFLFTKAESYLVWGVREKKWIPLICLKFWTFFVG